MGKQDFTIHEGLETISESMGLAATADCIMSIWQENTISKK